VDVQDKVTVARGVLGIVLGLVSYALIPFSIVVAMSLSLVGYAVSVFVSKALGAQTKWDLYLRATHVYFATWLLIVIVAYNLSL
jgi:hypothetical protein